MSHPTRLTGNFARLALWTLVAGAASVVAPSPASADERDRLYDLTDATYLRNGINPAAIGGRRQPGPAAVVDMPNFDYQRPVRATLTIGAYDHGAHPVYFTVFGGGDATLFTNDAAGRNARQIAERSPEYIFPPRGGDPLTLAGRQANVLDMRNGYFSNNPTGIWLHTWVSYTDAAFNTSEGRKQLNDLAQRNGLATDGTPIINTVGDIDKLSSKGLITKTTRATNDPLRYAFCPVIKDPRRGGIAPDQFLNYVRLPDGTPLEPGFLFNFHSLQTTGEWSN